MRRLLIATTNTHKLREIRRVLADVPVELTDLTAWRHVPEPEETGATFESNARLKALYYSERVRDAATGQPAALLTVADDSGLVIDALGGAPGVLSARFVHADATYPARFEEIFRRLAEQPGAARAARFICALAVADADGRTLFETTGVVEGEIADAPRGAGGFGYDPIFYYPPYGATLAEVSEEAKLRVAHRGQAFRRLADWLRTSEPVTRPDA